MEIYAKDFAEGVKKGLSEIREKSLSKYDIAKIAERYMLIEITSNSPRKDYCISSEQTETIDNLINILKVNNKQKERFVKDAFNFFLNYKNARLIKAEEIIVRIFEPLIFRAKVLYKEQVDLLIKPLKLQTGQENTLWEKVLASLFAVGVKIYTEKEGKLFEKKKVAGEPNHTFVKALTC